MTKGENWEIFCKVVSQSVPAILAMLLGTAIFMIDMYFIGQLKNVPMISGVGMGNMVINLFGLQTFVGLNGALETLVPQAVKNGEVDYETVKILLTRGKLIIVLAFIPMALCFINARTVLIMCNQDPQVAEYTQIYLYYSLPKVFLFGLFDCQRRCLNSLGKAKVPLMCQMVAVPLHVVWSQIFVINLGWGIVGTGVAGAISFSIAYGLLLIYCRNIVPSSYKNLLDLQSFWIVVNLAVPSCLMTWANWWIWEIMILLSGLFGVDNQATQIITMSIYGLFLMASLGFQQSICALVGREIGNLDIPRARKFQNIGYLTAAVFLTICAVVLYYNLTSFILIFVDRPVIIEPITKSFKLHFLICIAFIPDSLKQMKLSVVKSLALQTKACKISFYCNWVFNVFLIYVFSFRYEMEILGLWLAKFVTEILLSTSISILIESQNWMERAEYLKEQREPQVTDDYIKLDDAVTSQKSGFENNL